jgi:hypothetical protein
MLKYISAFLLLSCSAGTTKTHRELFDDFHTYFEKADFDKMDQLLEDSFVMTDSHGERDLKPDYMKYMMDWNKTFDTKWNVISVIDFGNKIISIEYDTDIFNDYFYNGKMKYRYTYTFNGNHISGLSSEALPEDDELRVNFHDRFKKFMDWVSVNHPAKTGYFTKRDKHSAEETKILLAEYLKTGTN